MEDVPFSDPEESSSGAANNARESTHANTAALGRDDAEDTQAGLYLAFYPTPLSTWTCQEDRSGREPAMSCLNMTIAHHAQSAYKATRAVILFSPLSHLVVWSDLDPATKLLGRASMLLEM